LSDQRSDPLTIASPVKLKNQTNPRNLVTSLILVFPLFLIYQLGVVLIYPMINGADFLTRFLFQNLGLSRSAYLGYTAAVAVLFAISVAVLRRRQRINLTVFIPVLFESAIYALTMGSVIVLVMTRVFGISPRLGMGLASGLGDQGPVTRMIMSVGAGVWEETTFRLGLLSGITFLCERVIGMRRFIAIGLAFVVSSFVFSAVHHIPPYGDPLHLGVFTFRFLAGICFGILFWFRGFAVAAYTHALYDIYVLIIHP
jgi:Type II CAAX prenyl endopeptidase Rce1-like